MLGEDHLYAGVVMCRRRQGEHNLTMRWRRFVYLLAMRWRRFVFGEPSGP